jgi:hypothetical protein
VVMEKRKLPDTSAKRLLPLPLLFRLLAMISESAHSPKPQAHSPGTGTGLGLAMEWNDDLSRWPRPESRPLRYRLCVTADSVR